MKKLLRRRWVIGALVLLVVVGGGYLVVPVGEPRISQATCDRIQVGWTKAQVEQLLGNDPSELWLAGRHSYWHDSDGNEIHVTFDDVGDRVMEKQFARSELSFFDIVKRRLERRIRGPKQVGIIY